MRSGPASPPPVGPFPAHQPPIVFYDGACGLCGREIAHYRRVDRAGRVRWVDISRETAELERFGLDPGHAMAVFHVRDPAGRMHLGVAGFLELWRHLPYYRWAARLVRLLRLRRPLEWGYARFARWRLARRGAAVCPAERLRGGRTRGSRCRPGP